MISETAIARLLTDLRDGDSSARRAALWALPPLLMGVDAVEAREALFTAIVDTEPEIRRLALQALASTGATPHDHGALVPALRDPDVRVRRAAVGAVSGCCQDAELHRALIAALRDCDEDVRVAACLALERAGPAATADAAPNLVRLLSDTAPFVREAALGAMIEMDGTSLPLDQMFRLATADPQPRVRAAALRLLSHATPSAEWNPIGTLTAALADADPDVRRVAAAGIGSLGAVGMPAVAQLRLALFDSDATVARAAAEALALVLAESKPWAPFLLQIRAARAGDSAVLGLMDQDADDVAVFLTECLTDADEHIRWNAALGLETCGPAAGRGCERLALMLGAEKASERVAALVGLLGPGPGAAAYANTVSARLHDDAMIVRRIAAVALGRMGPGAIGALPALRHAMTHDAREDVRRAATNAVALLDGSQTQHA